MRCPRCGLDNPPGTRACRRCGLPAPPPPPTVGGHEGGPEVSAGPVFRPAAPMPGGYPAGYSAVTYPPDPGEPPLGYRPPQPARWQPVVGEPVPDRSEAPSADGFALTITLAVGGLLSVAYGIWALTARRGLFEDFARGSQVDLGTARTSDMVNTVWWITALVVVAIALGWWLLRWFADDSYGGALDTAGIVVVAVGVIVVILGLFLTLGIEGAAGPVDQGRAGATSAAVTGCGFLVIALGLVLGLAALMPDRRTETGA